MSQFKLIAFDLDGTLVNSLPDLTNAVNFALNSEGLVDVTPEQVFQWIGNGTQKMIERAIQFVCQRDNRLLTNFDIHSIHQNFSNKYAQDFCNASKLYPQVKETLMQLKQMSYPLAIVTNKQSRYIQPILEKLEIFELFDLILGEQDVPAIKPHPAPIYYLCGKFGLYPKQILFVGDSKNDVVTATSAGSPVVGLTYGYTKEPIANFKPDWVLDNFGDLLKLIK